MIQLQYAVLPGVVSAAALTEHVKLFEGYLQRANESEYDLAGAVMHDLYFGGLTDKPSQVTLPVFRGAVTQAFGSVDAFKRDMRAAALSSPGWVVLAAKQGGEDLRLLTMSAHNAGVPTYTPIVAVDCYEHAYMDFGLTPEAKGRYIDALWNVLDWVELERRWARLRRAEVE